MPDWFILSDSHGASGYLKAAANVIREGNFAKIVHLGDFVSDARELSDLLGRSILSVAGNCDMFSREAKEMTVTTGEHKVLLTHGDRFRVKMGVDTLSYRAEEAGCSIALFGHTHIPMAQYVGSVLLINPGALLNGRYATLSFTENGPVPKLWKL